MKQKQDIQQAAKQLQRLILSPQMQQALQLLQLPIMELACLVTEEMAQNPLLELEDAEPLELIHELPSAIRPQTAEREEEDLKAFIESTLPSEKSLYETLMEQAYESFADKATYHLAQDIIGNIDDNGFLTTPLEEIALLTQQQITTLLPILEVIQTFEPLGVGGRTLQETLLIQLRAHRKASSLAYRIVEEGFDDMLKNRIPALAKKFQCYAQEIYETIANEIACLDFHPGKHFPSGHYKEPSQQIIPDIVISWIEDRFVIDVNRSPLPPVRVNKQYLDMLGDPFLQSDVKNYIQERLQSGRWLLRNLEEREHTLYRIAEKLVALQGSYLKDMTGQLAPLTMKELAEMLSLHESTIARAVSHKYISCPRGILSLKSLFTNAYTTTSGEVISSSSVKDYLKDIIDKENKNDPLSDEDISRLIKQRGIACARRTIAKYRQELGIGNTLQRKNHLVS